MILSRRESSSSQLKEGEASAGGELLVGGVKRVTGDLEGDDVAAWGALLVGGVKRATENLEGDDVAALGASNPATTASGPSGW